MGHQHRRSHCDEQSKQGLVHDLKVATNCLTANPLTKSKSKWAMLTSHCARRSFCTNNYLMGTDALTIMAISGHQTEKSFRRYLKLGPEHYTSRMASSVFFFSKAG